MYPYWDMTYLLVLIGAALCAAASWNVSHTFRKYRPYYNSRGIPAEVCAEMILRNAGIFDVRIEHIQGELTDHYAPREKVLRLSDAVYGSTSVAALGVAAHECGHAIQHQTGYFPLKLRSASIPAANIGSALSWPIILLGLVLGQLGVARLGVLLFGLVVLLQFITLPVEFNASRRALAILDGGQILTDQELQAAARVLNAAALTYVAALFSSILQMLRLILLTRGDDRRR